MALGSFCAKTDTCSSTGRCFVWRSEGVKYEIPMVRQNDLNPLLQIEMPI